MFHFLNFLGYWKWPNIISITVVPVLFFLLSWKPNFDPEPFGTTILGPEPVGPWVVVLGTNQTLPLEPSTEVRWQVRFCNGCYEQIHKVELSLGSIERPLWPPSSVIGHALRLSATLLIPRAFPNGGLYIWLAAKGPNGHTYTVSWLVATGS
jgi:hypothetical protein